MSKFHNYSAMSRDSQMHRASNYKYEYCSIIITMARYAVIGKSNKLQAYCKMAIQFK